YADIYDENGDFSSWDTNNNGVFGEWTGNIAEDSNIDLYPDVYVGRLACRNIIEVRIMVDKIIKYETKSSNQEWFNKIVVVAGDTYPESINPDWKGNEGEENTIKILQNMSEFEAVKLWTSDGSFSGPRDVIQAINEGCGFLYFDGHANPYSWSTHPPNDAEKWIDGLSVLTMSFLRNRDKLPICVVGGCHNLQFDVHLTKLKDDPWYYYTWIPECWGWKLTRKIGGGSIATIGCTGLGMTKEDKESFSGAGDYLEPTFFYEIGMNNTNVLGEAWGNTITDYLNKYPIDWNTPAAWDYAIDAKTVQQWALLGDPSLRIGGVP
ncbi:MAG: peptidase C25, partial [Thermoplasmatales archaeon]|nr:peptidase C25 [Thermoplasmatales archaeon]